MTPEQHDSIWQSGYQAGLEAGKTEGRYEKFSEWDDRYNKPKDYDIGNLEEPPVVHDDFYKMMLEKELA
jgi:hypothetical protein